MATQWQGPQYIAILAAAGLAFGAGYLVAGRSRPAASPPMATNTSNGVEPGSLPGFDTNGQAPRGRPDENELIARNAEPDGTEQPHDMGTPRNQAQPEERRPRPPREQPDSKPPPSDSVEDDQGPDPDDR
jgi:hypothetical protein